MITATTQGVKISVESFFQPEYSNPMQEQYVFAYRITIENNSGQTVQLLRRNWLIFDSLGQDKVVEGEGVIGEQPSIEEGKTYTYVSGCHLQSALGKMRGSYLMTKVSDDSRFFVTIPEFSLIAPEVLN